MRKTTACLSLLALAVSGAACSKRKGDAAGGGAVSIDGSSTVFLISAAAAERAKKEIGVDVTVASSGTGGGMKKFCAGEIDIADASRPIKPAEADACKAKNIEFIELPVAYDGIAVVVNPKNAFVDKLTVDELKKIWAPEAEGKVTSWAQVRDGFPDQPLRLGSQQLGQMPQAPCQGADLLAGEARSEPGEGGSGLMRIREKPAPSVSIPASDRNIHSATAPKA